MSKNDAYMRDAELIYNELSEVRDLNVSSVSLLRQSKVFHDDKDGRWAFDFAKRAKVMHDYIITARSSIG